MNAADIYRYSNRAEVDREIDAKRARIIADRRREIGYQAAWQEAQDVTTDYYRAEYQRIENEVMARWGIDA